MSALPSFVHFGFTKKDFVRVGYAFAFAFAGAYVAFVDGIGQFKDVSSAKAAALALIPAAITAAIAAAKNAVLADGTLAKG